MEIGDLILLDPQYLGMLVGREESSKRYLIQWFKKLDDGYNQPMPYDEYQIIVWRKRFLNWCDKNK